MGISRRSRRLPTSSSGQPETPGPPNCPDDLPGRRALDRRQLSGHVAGLAAGLLTALTPSAALMFRFNNPDALLLFLLVLAGALVLRAIERASATWLIVAGALVGLGFLTKMMQAFLVLPAFALVYLIAAPTSLRRRLLHLLGALASMIVSLTAFGVTFYRWAQTNEQAKAK